MQTALEVTHVPPEVNPPTHLRTAILSAGAAQANPQPRILPRRTRSFSWSQAMNVAAAALIIALGINNYRLQRTLQATETASLRVSGLPPLPEGKVYTLWTVVEPNAPFTVDSKGAILTDAFVVDEQENAIQRISVPPVFRNQKFVTKVAITIELLVPPAAQAEQLLGVSTCSTPTDSVPIRKPQNPVLESDML